MVAEFTGALPEPRVRQWLAPMLPSRADELTGFGATLADRGELQQAEVAFREALAEESGHVGARAGLAAILADRGEHNEARELVKPVLHDPRARRVDALIRFRTSVPGEDHEELERRLAADPKDLDAHHKLAGLL